MLKVVDLTRSCVALSSESFWSWVCPLTISYQKSAFAQGDTLAHPHWDVFSMEKIYEFWVLDFILWISNLDFNFRIFFFKIRIILFRKLYLIFFFFINLFFPFPALCFIFRFISSIRVRQAHLKLCPNFSTYFSFMFSYILKKSFKFYPHFRISMSRYEIFEVTRIAMTSLINFHGTRLPFLSFFLTE